MIEHRPGTFWVDSDSQTPAELIRLLGALDGEPIWQARDVMTGKEYSVGERFLVHQLEPLEVLAWTAK